MNMKPCYFCGSTKTSVKARRTKYYMHETIVASVRCNSCKSRGPVASGNIALGSYGEELRGDVPYSEAKQEWMFFYREERQKIHEIKEGTEDGKH